MDGYHNIYLQCMVAILSAYNAWLPCYPLTMDGYQGPLVTMNGYHSIYLQWTVIITCTYNDGCHNIYLKCTVSITYPFNERLP